MLLIGLGIICVIVARRMLRWESDHHCAICDNSKSNLHGFNTYVCNTADAKGTTFWISCLVGGATLIIGIMLFFDVIPKLAVPQYEALSSLLHQVLGK